MGIALLTMAVYQQLFRFFLIHFQSYVFLTLAVNCIKLKSMRLSSDV